MTGEPVSKGQIDSTFQRLITMLASQAKKQATAAGSSGARVWQIPDELRTALTDVAAISTGFDRKKLNQLFASLIEDGGSPGTAGDAVGVKIQVDYVGALERAFRARHASPLRCLAHAAGRREGHGHTAGIFSDAAGVLCFVNEAIKAGRGETGYVA